MVGGSVADLNERERGVGGILLRRKRAFTAASVAPPPTALSTGTTESARARIPQRVVRHPEGTRFPRLARKLSVRAGERRRDKGLGDGTSVLSTAALPSLFAVLPPGTDQETDLQEPRAGDRRPGRLHRFLLQSNAPSQSSRWPQSRTIRSGSQAALPRSPLNPGNSSLAASTPDRRLAQCAYGPGPASALTGARRLPRRRPHLPPGPPQDAMADPNN